MWMYYLHIRTVCVATHYYIRGRKARYYSNASMHEHAWKVGARPKDRRGEVLHSPARDPRNPIVLID